MIVEMNCVPEHLHVDVQQMSTGTRRTTEPRVLQILRLCRILQQNFLEDAGLSSDPVVKKSGTERTLTNAMEHGIRMPLR